ncbi:MAG TPA: prepilin peptidase [Pirellulales bacterium]|jgi:prepilin signal peptidase PulO-like enzyme (type II secretory pathway)|nr:prepilin peptidase [Pirellulales bacterium]
MQHLHDLIIAHPGILAFWVFVVGSAIGSFLNVVIYRMPRGMSLSKPGSHCPKCGRPIRWYDNLPIAGWLLLRGKCRDCQATISPRYPLVELAIAVLFVATAYFDVYRPTFEAALDAAATMDSTPLKVHLGMRLLAMFAHVWAGCTLIAALFIAWDGQRVPWPLVIPAAAVTAFGAPFLEITATWSLIAATCGAVVVAFVRNRTLGRLP